VTREKNTQVISHEWLRAQRIVKMYFPTLVYLVELNRLIQNWM